MRKDQVSTFIKRLREVDPRWMRKTFTNGACYELFRILRTIWPDAEPWVAEWQSGWLNACHVYTLIDGWFYDIKGWHKRETILKHVAKQGGEFRRMTVTDESLSLEMNPRRLRDTWP